MNKLLTIGLLAATAAGFAAPASAQTLSNSATADSTVTIITPLSIVKASDLTFGTVAKPLTGSATVAISATDGTRTLGTGLAAMTGSTGRATFTVTGDTGRTFAATIPTSFKLSNGTVANDITVTLTSDVPAGLTGTTATIGVGGSFSLASTQVVGDYTGSFAVSVAYN